MTGRAATWIGVVSGVAAVVNLGAAVVLAAAVALFRVFACESGCTPDSPDWTERLGAWQWNVALPLSLGVLLAAVLLAGCVSMAFLRSEGGRRWGLTRSALLTVPPLIIQVGLLAGLWMLAESTHRSQLNAQLAWLAAVVLTTGATAVSGALRIAS